MHWYVLGISVCYVGIFPSVEGFGGVTPSIGGISTWDVHMLILVHFCSALCLTLSARYWGELQPNICKRFPNLLYTAELLCIKQNKNKVLPPYVNSPCHKVAHARNYTSSFSISAILHSCMLGYSCFFYLLISLLFLDIHQLVLLDCVGFVSIGMHLGIF